MADDFDVGQKVLAYNGSLLYDAKILKKSVEKLKIKYHIHYLGWRERWDEWVDETKLLPMTPENQKKAKELSEAAGVKRKGRKASADDAEDVKTFSSYITQPAQSGGNKKRRVETQVKKKPRIEIFVPMELKKRLVMDWKLVSTKQALVNLPRKPTAYDIVKDFIESRSKEEQRNMREVLEGLLIYFDKALGSILLYRFERPQYADIVKSFTNKRLCEVYGAEHLLRLFVKLPDLLVRAEMTEDARDLVKAATVEFLRYMEEEAHKLFDPSAYDAPTSQYVRLLG